MKPEMIELYKILIQKEILDCIVTLQHILVVNNKVFNDSGYKVKIIKNPEYITRLIADLEKKYKSMRL